jgi:hypothetical protein
MTASSPRRSLDIGRPFANPGRRSVDVWPLSAAPVVTTLAPVAVEGSTSAVTAARRLARLTVEKRSQSAKRKRTLLVVTPTKYRGS